MNATLVVLAAGLSSRFGAVEGQKVVETVSPNGEVICDFSVYDAIRAGFNKIVYVIKKENQAEFVRKVSSKIKGAEVIIAFQDMEDLPEGFAIPLGRTKPWGTCHALWAARHAVNEPFMVISADDFYGRGIFESMYQFLTTQAKGFSFAMPGHRLSETISDHGSVNRAVCLVDDAGFVEDIREVRNIEKTGAQIGYTDPKTGYHPLPDDSIVNMLAFAFTPKVFDEIEKGFGKFYETYVKDNIDAEYFLTLIVKSLILEMVATMKVLPVDPKDRWIGVTYKPDVEIAKESIAKLINAGEYPQKLF